MTSNRVFPVVPVAAWEACCVFPILIQTWPGKISAHKKNIGGLEAPRNSLELQVEESQSCYSANSLYSYQMDEEWSESHCYPVEASMKKLINEEISKQQSSRRNTPSIVARLMGMDTFPLDTKSAVQPTYRKNEAGVKISKKEEIERGPVMHSWQVYPDPVDHFSERDSVRWDCGQKSGRPKSREHPQEAELQKFKKDFESWQASRFRECSRPFELGSSNRLLVSPENPGGRVMEPYAVNHGDHKALKLKTKSNEKEDLQYHRHKSELFPVEKTECFPSESRTLMTDHQKLDVFSAPSKIVILKPGPDRIYDHNESWTNSYRTVEERGSIVDFLEEVKERLKCEVQGKVLKKSCVVRGSGIETPFSERSPDPKQIAQHIARHVRETATRDFDMNLLRSESTRSYRSEIHFDDQSSPEFINRTTRKFFSKRMKNVVKGDIHIEVPEDFSSSTRSPVLGNENMRLRNNSTAKNKQSYWEIMNDEHKIQKELSPRNLMRSLSAPVSETSFAKLLLEDRHNSTGAHIRRKHEVVENVSLDMRKSKKDRFNFKGKVSLLKYSFALRGRLFGKKIQSIAESHRKQCDFARDFLSGPTVMNFSERHENPTKLPPSPASVCSSTQDEFWRPVDYHCLSPVSRPDTIRGEDSDVPEVFKEISCNLIELRRQLNELVSDTSEDPTTTKEHNEVEMGDLEDEEEAYIRDLLIVSGLYDGSFDKLLISNSVFEKVEESYRASAKGDDGSRNKVDNRNKLDRKLLLDLLNESLSVVLGPHLGMSRFRRKMTSRVSMLTTPRGKTLLEIVWEMIQEYLYPWNQKSYYLFDDMVIHDLESSSWTSLVDDEVTLLGKEVEGLVMEDLIIEVVKDFHS